MVALNTDALAVNCWKSPAQTNALDRASDATPRCDFGKIFFYLQLHPGKTVKGGNRDSEMEYWTQVWLWLHMHVTCAGSKFVFSNPERVPQQLSEDRELDAPLATAPKPLHPPLTALPHTDHRRATTHVCRGTPPHRTLGQGSQLPLIHDRARCTGGLVGKQNIPDTLRKGFSPAEALEFWRYSIEETGSPRKCRNSCKRGHNVE